MTRKEKTPKEIQIAKYALIGTFITAACGVIGTLIGAYLTYLGPIAQADRQIAATQTAEVIASYTPVPTNTPRVTPTLTPLAAESVLRVETAWSGCPVRHMLPDYIEPDKYPYTANDQFRTLLAGEKEGESIFPFEANENWQASHYSFTLTSLSTNKEWVLLDKKITLYVRRQDAPDYSNIAQVGGCGGVQEIRNFPEFFLDSKYETYTADETYADDTIAGFKLMPGEPELFRVPFTCKTPGIYNLEVGMEIEYLGQKDEVRVAVPPITCPKAYSIWDVRGSQVDDVTLTFIGKRFWDGAQYEYFSPPMLSVKPLTNNPSFINIQYTNKCDEPLNLAINYKNLNDDWVTDGWWTLQPGESANVANTKNNIFYYYGVTQDNDYVWEGTDTFQKVNGTNKSYGFREFDMNMKNWGNFEFRWECD